MGLTGALGDETDYRLQNEFPAGDVTAQKQHGDANNDRRIDELLVFLHAFLLGLPRPGSFLEFDFDFGDERFGSEHGWEK